MHLKAIVGIDIAKLTFQAAILVDDEKTLSKNFPNTAKGFAQLDAWLRNRKVTTVRACMEATNSYWEALAHYLYERRHEVVVVNPADQRHSGKARCYAPRTTPSTPH